MNIRKKPIESVRIRKNHGEALKQKAFELSMKAKELIPESELIHYLLDTQLEKLDVTKDGKLYLKKSEE